MNQIESKPTTDLGTRRALHRLIGPTLLGSVFVALLSWTWRKWPDLLIDFGRELYVPWQLSEGAVLYRDIAYINGPFSPYFNALLFQGFGVSLTTLAVANAVLLAVLVTVVYRWVARLLDRLTATLACLVLLCVFGFAHLIATGNYNYICPYSHELTHGLTLSMLMLVLLIDRPRRINAVRLIGAGVCFGLIFLGKAELFVAAAGATIAALGLWRATGTVTTGRWLAGCSIFAAAAFAPIASFTFALSSSMPLGEALAGVAGSWRWIFAGGVVDQSFYRAIAGWDRPLENLLAVGRASLLVALAITAAVALDRWIHQPSRRKLWSIIGGLSAAAVLLIRGPNLPLLLDAPALLLIALLACGLLIAAAIRRRDDRRQFNRLAPLAVWSVFALLLLGKVILLPRIHHYGFALAMPITVLAVVCLLGLLPRLLCGQRGGAWFRATVAILILLDIGSYLNLSADKLNRKTFAVGRGSDSITAYNPHDSRSAKVMSQLLAKIDRHIPADATVVALPEGAMINYLSRRTNPTPYINLMPPELAMYGQPRIIAALSQARPDYILLVHKDTTEYGVRFFGQAGFGQQVNDWVEANYRPVETLGARPFTDERFGVQILQRRD